MTVPQEIPFKPEGPQPLVRAPVMGANYPVAALGPLQAAVEAVQGQTLAPVAIAAQSALSVAALAVQGFADVETLGGPRPVSLYCLTIAKSGERKSGCDGPFMAALRRFEREQSGEQRAAMDKWQNDHALWDTRRKHILAEAKSPNADKRTGAEADLAALGPEPAMPPMPDRTVTEPTFEGLTHLYASGMPSLGIFSDEGGQFLGGYAMLSENRQKSVAALNSLWQGDPIKRTRKGDGAFTLWNRRLSTHLMVQPGVAHTFLADPLATDTGFLARQLMTEPPTTMGNRLEALKRPNPAAMATFDARLTQILRTDLPVDEKTGGLVPHVLALSEGACALLVKFADAVETEMRPGGQFSGLTGTASKAAEQACRIAGVLTLWSDLNAAQVSIDDMQCGIDLAQFYLGEALRLSEAALVSAETERAETLRIWLLERWPGIARREGRSSGVVLPRDVVQYGPNALRETKAVKAALGMLAANGWVTELDPGTEVDGAQRRQAYRIEGAYHVL